MAKFSFAAKEKKEKKPLTPAQKRAKTAINWIVSVLCVAIIIIALAISVLTITRTTGEKGVANIFGNAFMPVQSDSMTGTFEKDDLIITKVYNGDGSDLQVGQVVTYKTVKNGYEFFNTHRIVEKVGSGADLYFRTKGDKEGLRVDSDFVTAKKIVATWGTPADVTKNEDDSYTVTVSENTYGKNWGQIGKAINWLQNDRKNYFLVIVLPLILLFVLYAYVLIRTFVIAKLAKVKEETAAAATGGTELSEEERKRLALEYLAQIAAKNGEELPVELAAITPDAPAAEDTASEEPVAEEAVEQPAEEPVAEEAPVDEVPVEEPVAEPAEQAEVEQAAEEQAEEKSEIAEEAPVAEPEKKAAAKKAPAKKTATAAKKPAAKSKKEDAED